MARSLSAELFLNGHDGDLLGGSCRSSLWRAADWHTDPFERRMNQSNAKIEALPPVDLERAWNFFKLRAERG